MTGASEVFVSKRLRRPAMVLVCLTLMQLLFVLANCEGEHAPMAAHETAPAHHGS